MDLPERGSLAGDVIRIWMDRVFECRPVTTSSSGHEMIDHPGCDSLCAEHEDVPVVGVTGLF